MNVPKLLVISDIHGNSLFLDALLRWAKDYSFETAVFLGDGIDDLNRVAASFPFEWKIVRGNNDYEHNEPEAASFEFFGHRFFICHGHRHALYSDTSTLIAAARNVKAEAVLFGHTHAPFLRVEHGIMLANPGSIGRPRSRHGSTFAVIDCLPEKPLNAHFWQINSHEDISKLKF